jgi:hypothetical protein
MLGNFVFDIDSTITIINDGYNEEERNKINKEYEDRLGVDFLKRHSIKAMGYTHNIFPGYYALFRWLHTLGANLIFFSSGVKERNVEFAANFMSVVFGDENVPYKVFSREDCIDTTHMPQEIKGLYQPYRFGNRKKKLAGIVVPEAEINNTILIDDDTSYMCKGEEFNFVNVKTWYTYVDDGGVIDFYNFHSAYYLAALFKDMFEHKKQTGKTLVECAKYAQIDKIGASMNKVFYFHGVYQLHCYEEGLEILKTIDPSLHFHAEPPKENDFELRKQWHERDSKKDLSLL